jgi:methionine-gamma-lyase
MSDNKKLSPESLMMSYGYTPNWSEGSIKCPIYQTSTFVFESAEEGKSFFEQAYGSRERKMGERIPGLIYSRLNNPDIEILENRMALWDQAEDCASFESGMAAISTVMFEFCSPGGAILFSSPTYGGTDHFIRHFLKKINVDFIEFFPWETEEEIKNKIHLYQAKDRLQLIYIETPANPTNDLFDISMMVAMAKEFSSEKNSVKVAVDNTYMGPLWQHPLQLGADITLYSATKYIGGHSDVIAGVVCGNKADILRVKTLRTFLGNMCAPFTAWLLMRSLETLKIRMEEQARNADKVALFLKQHPKVSKVYFLGHLSPKDGKYFEIFKKQYTSGGAMISFDVKGGEEEAFQFLNALRLCKLAVSLGSTESLAEHPATMTHSGVHPDLKAKIGITSSLIRLSIGVENANDLIRDLDQALNTIQ